MKYPIAILAVIVLFGSCDRNRNHPGWTFFPDMEESQAYETWDENPYFEGNKMMVGPVEGTVATHEHAYHFEKTPEDELRAASLENPLAGEFNQEHALMLYNRYCLICHGPEGDGQGSLFTSGKYPIPPASFHSERATSKTDGQLFHNIRAGFGVMGPHGPMMPVEDSWQLVNYIRHLQKQKPETAE
ncbi:MAG: c-type cytochrome [Mariniphaga sp.]